MVLHGCLLLLVRLIKGWVYKTYRCSLFLVPYALKEHLLGILLLLLNIPLNLLDLLFRSIYESLLGKLICQFEVSFSNNTNHILEFLQL